MIKAVMTSEGKYVKPIIGANITITDNNPNFFDSPGNLSATVPYYGNQRSFKCCGYAIDSTYGEVHKWYLIKFDGGDTRWVADYDVISGGVVKPLCLLIHKAFSRFSIRKAVAL